LAGKPVQLKNGSIAFPTNFGNLIFVSPDGKLRSKSSAEVRNPTSFEVNKVKSSPVVTNNDQVIIGSVDGNLYIFNNDGVLKTKFKTNGPIVSTPVIMKDGTIVIGSSDHNVYFLNPDGTQKKKVTLSAEISGTALILKDETVVIGTDDKKLNFIDPNGNIKTSEKLYSSAAPVQMKDGAIVIGSENGIVYFFNPDGTEKTRYFDASLTGINRAVTILNDETIVVMGYDGFFSMLTISKEKKKTRTITVEVPCLEKKSSEELRIIDLGRGDSSSKHENAIVPNNTKSAPSKQK
jgi:outer membrane protein assembly factor BamB